MHWHSTKANLHLGRYLIPLWGTANLWKVISIVTTLTQTHGCYSVRILPRRRTETSVWSSGLCIDNYMMELISASHSFCCSNFRCYAEFSVSGFLPQIPMTNNARNYCFSSLLFLKFFFSYLVQNKVIRSLGTQLLIYENFTESRGSNTCEELPCSSMVFINHNNKF